MIANIGSDDALILPHRANPQGWNFRERPVAKERYSGRRVDLLRELKVHLQKLDQRHP